MSRRYFKRRRRYYKRNYGTDILGIAILVLLAGALLLQGLIEVGEFVENNLWIMQALLALSVIVLLILAVNWFINRQSERFVEQHSIAVRELQTINREYTFADVYNFDVVRTYDNEKMYDDIALWDCLTYMLAEQHQSVLNAIALARANRKKWNEYSVALEKVRRFGRYDTDRIPVWTNRIRRKEEEIFQAFIHQPTVRFTVEVRMKLTNIKGRIKEERKVVFDEQEIETLIQKVRNKNGGFYLDNSVWESLCRVERGKVTNKIRFMIYQRDGYRCKQCGRKTDDLEIDHIFPISKGGKSTIDNLQTLCHRCNYLKSDTVALQHRDGENCALCGAPLRIRNGKKGAFYGCSNYPQCRFTKGLK